MIFNNIIFILLLIIIVGVVVYFYYDNKNNNENNENDENVIPNKKVSFTDNKKLRKQNISPEISIGSSIFNSTDKSDNISTESCSPSDSKPNQVNFEESWDNNFGLPLVNKKDKNKFINKIKENHKNYEKSLGQFTKYQTDNDTLLEENKLTDPSKLKGRSIKEIYDHQVAGPKAKPKHILKRTSERTIYDNEVESNGGQLAGSKLYGFDEAINKHKSAIFGDEF